MKKTLMTGVVLVALVAFSASAFAKGATRFAQKGTLIGAGSVGFVMNTETPDVDGAVDTKTTAITFMPAIGYFVANNILVYGQPVFNSTSTTVDGNDAGKSSQYGIALGGAYYIPLQGTMFARVGADLGYLMGGTETPMGDTTAEADLSSWYLRGLGGIAISFGGKFGGFAGIDLFFQYGNQTYKPDGGDESKVKMTNFGLLSNLGIFF